MATASKTDIFTAYAAGVAPKKFDRHPLITKNAVEYESPSAVTLYGVDRKRSDADVIKFEGDGTTTLYTSDGSGVGAKKIAALTGLHDDAGALDVTNTLRIVVLVNEVPLPRDQSVVANPDTPAAGRFSVDVDAGVTQIVFGTAPAKGAKVRIFKNAASDIQTIGALTANVAKQDVCHSFMVSSHAANIRGLC